MTTRAKCVRFEIEYEDGRVVRAVSPEAAERHHRDLDAACSLATVHGWGPAAPPEFETVKAPASPEAPAHECARDPDAGPGGPLVGTSIPVEELIAACYRHGDPGKAAAAKAALLSAISRAVSEARREAAEEALRVVAECAGREGLLNDDEAIICGGEVFDRIRALASTTSPKPLATCNGDVGWHLRMVNENARLRAEVEQLRTALAAAERERDEAREAGRREAERERSRLSLLVHDYGKEANVLASRVSALEGALNGARLTARPVIADDGARASVAAGAWSALCALAPAALSAPAPDAATTGDRYEEGRTVKRLRTALREVRGHLKALMEHPVYAPAHDIVIGQVLSAAQKIDAALTDAPVDKVTDACPAPAPEDRRDD